MSVFSERKEHPNSGSAERACQRLSRYLGRFAAIELEQSAQSAAARDGPGTSGVGIGIRLGSWEENDIIFPLMRAFVVVMFDVVV